MCLGGCVGDEDISVCVCVGGGVKFRLAGIKPEPCLET